MNQEYNLNQDIYCQAQIAKSPNVLMASSLIGTTTVSQIYTLDNALFVILDAKDVQDRMQMSVFNATQDQF